MTSIRIWVAGLCMTGWVVGQQFPSFKPETPLIGALLHGDPAEAKKLLAEGADPNKPSFIGFPPVFLAVTSGDAGLLQAMADKGADLKARDASGSTALMWAAASESGNPAMVNELIRLGVDPNAKNLAGETALTWASRRGETAIVAALRKAGASDEMAIRDAAQRSVSLLQKSGSHFLRVSGCTSCHHQSLPQMTTAMARSRGLTVDEALAAQSKTAVTDLYKQMREVFMTTRDNIPDPPVTVSYALMGLAAEEHPADETTAAMAHLLTKWQMDDGGFRAFPLRPPSEESHFTATAVSLRALQLYGSNQQEAVARAAAWLANASPRSTEDRAMQLLGLTWAGASSELIAQSARALIAEQRPEGGWGQLPKLETDAYATGQALVALNWSGRVSTSDEVYRNGVAFLMRTQFPDGSWLVRTRSFPVQKYKESGFPHGKNQWISAAGTSWAAMALTATLPEITPSN